MWSIGYDCQWHIISAIAIGSPHIRERIWIIAYPNGELLRQKQEQRGEGKTEPRDNGKKGIVPDTKSEGLEGLRLTERLEKELAEHKRSGWWSKEAQPEFYRMDDGTAKEPHRNKRIKAIGNSLLPQITEIIGKAIMEQPK